jgi:hypothetical protein
MAAVRIRDRYLAKGEKVPALIDKTAHPTQELYQEVGDMVIETIDREGYLRLRSNETPHKVAAPPRLE